MAEEENVGIIFPSDRPTDLSPRGGYDPWNLVLSKFDIAMTFRSEGTDDHSNLLGIALSSLQCVRDDS